MPTNGLVSVIIPTYNRASVIGRAIDSVLGQTYHNVEIIVVDDGSTDDTQERLKPYGGRIRVLIWPNAGPAVARNRGIGSSHGEFVAFQDSDDLWMPTKLERQVELLRRAGGSVPCCICNAYLYFASRDVKTSFENALLLPLLEYGLWTNVGEVLSTRFVLFNQTITIRRKILERIGGFDETLRFNEDHELPLRLSLQGPWAFIREPLVNRYQGSVESWSERADTERICSVECRVRMYESFIARSRDRGLQEIMRRNVGRELRRANRWLRAARIRQMKFRGASTLGSSLETVERYRAALFRRTPWFPKMVVEQI